MSPNNAQNLPLVPASAQPPVAPPTAPPAPPLSAEAASAHAVAQARQLAIQYANDPYKLSEAFGRLKAAYLAEQYHITANQTDG